MTSRVLHILLVTSALFLAGCQTFGSLVYESRGTSSDGSPLVRRVEIKTPTGAVHPGAIEIALDGTMSANTGAAQKHSAASKSLGRLPWLGGLLLVAGVLAFAIRIKLPFLPLELGVGLAVSGLLLMVLPSLIEAYLSYILIGLIASAAIITIYRVNKSSLRLRQLDPADPTPDPSAPADPSA